MPRIRWKPGTRIFNKAIGIPGVGWCMIKIGEQVEVTDKELAVLTERYGDAFDVVAAPAAQTDARRNKKK